MLSVISCRTRRPRLAPSDSRSAISARRSWIRASSRFARLVEASSSAKATTAIRIAAKLIAERRNGVPMRPGGARPIRLPSLTSGCSRSSCSATPLSAASAAARLTPGLSRPCSIRISTSRASSQAVPISISACIAAGNQKSGAMPSCVPKNPSGATPITEKARPFTVSVRPTAPGSPP